MLCVHCGGQFVGAGSHLVGVCGCVLIAARRWLWSLGTYQPTMVALPSHSTLHDTPVCHHALDHPYHPPALVCSFIVKCRANGQKLTKVVRGHTHVRLPQLAPAATDPGLATPMKPQRAQDDASGLESKGEADVVVTPATRPTRVVDAESVDSPAPFNTDEAVTRYGSPRLLCVSCVRACSCSFGALQVRTRPGDRCHRSRRVASSSPVRRSSIACHTWPTQ